MNREFDRDDVIKNDFSVFEKIIGKLDIKGKPIDRYLNPGPSLVLRLPSQVPRKDKTTECSDI